LKVLLDEPFYASVEQLQLRPLDVRSEIYAFGAVLYHMVTGAAPFSDGDGSFEIVLERKLRDQVISPRQLNPEISPELETVILRSLRSNPDERITIVALEAAFRTF
jgi:eukaryotic-like serine/threonine-protein kinase